MELLQRHRIGNFVLKININLYDYLWMVKVSSFIKL